jgi:hypothetical protein
MSELDDVDALVAPNDWVEILDTKKSEYYYYNYGTGETTWHLPESFALWKNEEIDRYG